MRIITRLHNICIALDQLLFTALTLGKASPDETLSAYLYRTNHPARRWVDGLLWWDSEGPVKHCELAYRAELLRHHLPAGYRQNTEEVQQ